MNIRLIGKNIFFFQLVKKTTDKAHGKPVATYDDDYEAGGGSTVYKTIFLNFLFIFLMYLVRIMVRIQNQAMIVLLI